VHLPSQKEFMNHPHRWKLIMNKNMKWRMYDSRISNHQLQYLGH
jgi:hypothetical protein